MQVYYRYYRFLNVLALTG